MTFAAITAAVAELDRPPDADIASSAAAARYIADGCLVDGPVGRVGLEMEAHCFDPADPIRRPSWQEITDVLRWLSPLPGGSVVSVEPGGAVELSSPPADGVVPAIDAMACDQAVLRSAFADAGLGLVFWAPTRCARPNGSTRAGAIAPWNAISTPAAVGPRARR